MVAESSIPTQSRSAHAAIKGYEYQFDRTVLELLAAPAGSIIHIEGIEDIDLVDPDVSRATQVKYYEGQRYASPKTLRDPVRLMLEHHRSDASWEYVLHVHFGDPGDLPDSFTLEQLKTCLTKKERSTGDVIEYFSGMDDDRLRAFCNRLSIRLGETFDDQQRGLIEGLKSALDCSADEVEAIYLAKARDFVHESARSSDPDLRQATQGELLSFLSIQEILFSRWQLAALGRERYLRAQVVQLKRGGYGDTRKLRGLWLVLSEQNFAAAVEIVAGLANSLLGRLKNAMPWVVVLGGSIYLVRDLKAEIVRRGIDFNDGYESIEFSSVAFGRPPLVNVVSRANDKIKASSYMIRLVSEENFRLHVSAIPVLARLIVVGEKAEWHETVADRHFVLRDYETGLLESLMEEVA